MIYSVWNPDAKIYTYYETGMHDDRPPVTGHLSAGGKFSRAELGMDPATAGWPLPAGAKQTGTGADPRGMIATLGGLSNNETSLVKLLLAGGVGYWLWKHWGKKRK
jgi:hypothetical protein